MGLHRGRSPEEKIFRSRSWDRNREKIFLGVGVERKLFWGSESESESKKKFFQSPSRVSESKSVTPLITTRKIYFFLFKLTRFSPSFGTGE